MDESFEAFFARLTGLEAPFAYQRQIAALGLPELLIAAAETPASWSRS